MTRLHLPIGGVEDSATEAVSCLIRAEEHSISLIRVISHILAGPRKISSPNGPQEKRLGEGCRQDVSVEAALVHLPSSTLLCSVREKLGPPRGSHLGSSVLSARGVSRRGQEADLLPQAAELPEAPTFKNEEGRGTKRQSWFTHRTVF